MAQLELNEVDLALDFYKSKGEERKPFLVDHEIVKNFERLIKKTPEGIKVILVQSEEKIHFISQNSPLIKYHPQIGLVYVRAKNLSSIEIAGGAKLVKTNDGIALCEESILLGKMSTQLAAAHIKKQKLPIILKEPYLVETDVVFTKFSKNKLEEILKKVV